MKNCSRKNAVTIIALTATLVFLPGCLADATDATENGDEATSGAETALTASSRIYWGAWMDGNDTYGSGYGDAPWDANTWHLFESHAGKKTAIVHWGAGTPWDHDFDYWKGTFNLVQNAGDLTLVDISTKSVPLRDIAAGKYDASLKTWAQQAAAWHHPFFLRFDWEMNGGWFSWGTTSTNQNTPADFVAAWKRFHDLAGAANAHNITWVWCPNIDPYDKFTSLQKLYPGDGYVDWTCLDGYNKSSMTSWTSFNQLFSRSYSQLVTIAPTKPIMVGETSSEEVNGSKATWITNALSQLPTKMPQVKAFLWFNWRITANGHTWKWPIESSSSAQSAFKTGIGSSYFAPGGGFGGLPLDSKIRPL